jgi:hypothetical protein
MKVGEMIEALNKLDPNTEVFVNGYEGGKNKAVIGDVRTFYLNVYTCWYYGKHTDDTFDLAKGKTYETVQGVCVLGEG